MYLDFLLSENLDSENLEGFWKVKHLSISQANIGTMFKYLNKNSEMELIINQVNDDKSDITVLTYKLQFLKNLKHFKFCTSSYEFKVDNLLQAILEHLVNLEELCQLHEAFKYDVSLYLLV